MTIAMCYLTREGVVLGADSTATAGGSHFLNHAQKLFEIGEGGTLGALIWGLGGLPEVSHRTLFAQLGDQLAKTPPTSGLATAQAWIELFWAAYDASALVALFRALKAKTTYDATIPPDVGMRTVNEEQDFLNLERALVAGFCIAGRVGEDRTPFAFEIIFDPHSGKPTAKEISIGQYRFWGAPNMFFRLLMGYDVALRQSVVASPHWSATDAEFEQLVQPLYLAHPLLPLRDAIDFVHMCIYSTIKALKFSNFAQTCGGPIELATVSTDRGFRWVRHKGMDAALAEGTQS